MNDTLRATTTTRVLLMMVTMMVKLHTTYKKIATIQFKAKTITHHASLFSTSFDNHIDKGVAALAAPWCQNDTDG